VLYTFELRYGEALDNLLAVLPQLTIGICRATMELKSLATNSRLFQNPPMGTSFYWNTAVLLENTAEFWQQIT
jgi:hypothetical protein